MRPRFVALALAAAAGWSFAPSVSAGTTIKYLRYNPAFTVDVPDGRTAEETTTNLVHPLDFRLKKGRVDYSLQILYLSVADVTGRRAFVRELAQEQVRTDGMTGANYETSWEDKARNGLPLPGQVVQGKLGGVDHAYVFVLFVVKNHGYILAPNGPVASLEAGGKVADEIINSLQPLGTK